MNDFNALRWIPVSRINNNRFRVAAETLHADFAAEIPAAHLDCHFALTALAADLDALRTAMARENASELTARKHAADEQRDALTVFGVEAIRNGQRHFEADKRAAAEVLAPFVEERTSSFQTLGFDENTSELDQLLEDLAKPEATDALATLGLSAWLTALIEAADAFKAVRNEERALESSDETPLLRPVKRQIAQRIHLLFTVAAQYAEAGQEPWIGLLKRAAQTVAELKRYRTSSAEPSEAEVPETASS